MDNPKFELVILADPEGILSGAAVEIAKTGVPRSLVGHSYNATDQFSVISVGGARVVVFGITGVFGRICIEPESGKIIEVPAPEKSTQINFVNRSLADFSSCVKAVIERFPFYSIDCNPQESEAAAEEIRQAIVGIDDKAMVFRGFWESFTDDVAIGDFATELVVPPDNTG